MLPLIFCSTVGVGAGDSAVLASGFASGLRLGLRAAAALGLFFLRWLRDERKR